jgi:hypothetical protein
MTYPVSGTNTVLTNPDGWTRWYNAVEFTDPGIFGYTPGALGTLPNPTATVNGYKLFADDLGSTANSATWLTSNQGTRAIFAAGKTNQRRMSLKFAMSGGNPVVKFQYAVVASWAKPSSDNPLPQDFPLTANIQEASQLRIDSSNSTLFYTSAFNGGDIVLSVDVFDWQGINNIKGQINKIIVDSSVLSTPFVDSAPSLSQTTGSPFATYSKTIEADNVSSTDDVLVWVIVEGKSPNNYDNGTGSAYPVGKPLAAIGQTTVSVSDEAPYNPPQIVSGIVIQSGTTQCPDRTSDTNAIFRVVATGDFSLTYKWNVMEVKNPQPVEGYHDVPGDGAGKLNVNFTAPAFADISEQLLVTCQVSDGVFPPVNAKNMDLFLDCIVFHADMNDYSHPDNKGWWKFDEAGNANWTLIGGTDAGSSLTGTGALWQNTSGGVGTNSKGILRSGLVLGSSLFSAMHLEVDHSYSMTPGMIGGSIKLEGVLTTPHVGGQGLPILSGHGYDAAITDSSNPLNPYDAFTAIHTPSGLYTSVVNVPNALKTNGFYIEFQAASGSASMADGGWLIDDVRVIGIL